MENYSSLGFLWAAEKNLRICGKNKAYKALFSELSPTALVLEIVERTFLICDCEKPLKLRSIFGKAESGSIWKKTKNLRVDFWVSVEPEMAFRPSWKAGTNFVGSIVDWPLIRGSIRY